MADVMTLQEKKGPVANTVVAWSGEHVDLAPVGHEPTGTLGVGEEAHRGLGVDEDEVADPFQLSHRHLA